MHIIDTPRRLARLAVLTSALALATCTTALPEKALYADQADVLGATDTAITDAAETAGDVPIGVGSCKQDSDCKGVLGQVGPCATAICTTHGKCLAQALAEGSMCAAGTACAASGNHGALLQRFSANGSLKWTRKPLGGKQHGELTDVIELDNGELLMVGDWVDDLDKTEARKAWFVRTSAQGATLENVPYGEADMFDAFWAVRATADRAYNIGYTESFTPKTKGRDGWVAVTDMSGSVVKHITVGDERDDEFYGASMQGAETSPSFPVLGGFRTDKQEHRTGWLVAMSAVGNIAWQRHFSAPGSLYIYDLRPVPGRGGFMLAGSVADAAKNTDAWLARVDSMGFQRWTRSYGGAKYEHFQAGRVAANGDIVLVGATRSLGKGKADAWLVRVDQYGNEVCHADCVAPSSACADGKPCTNDGCGPATGKCKFAGTPDGVACDGGACAAQVCKPK